MTTTTVDQPTIAYDQRITRYFYVAGVGYDHILTFGPEVRYIWKSGNLRTSAWYLFVRYFALFTSLGMLAFDFGNFPIKHRKVTISVDQNFDSCTTLNDTYAFLIVAQELTVGCTLILRVLAMYSFDKRVMFALGTVAIVGGSLAAWCIIPTSPVPVYKTNIPGCHTPASKAQQIRLAGAWEALLGADIILLSLTLYRGYTHNLSRRVPLPAGSLWRIVVRDGAVYFVVICLANLATILVYYFGNINTTAGLSTFTVSLSVTMMCRLMLNLHEAASVTNDSAGLATIGSLQFAGEATTWQEAAIRRTQLWSAP
ncbi:hypothetical protein GGX14DRAFT_575711 [Mycena pura]|uniref:DUF6533 domain-containing protein n=1 Tax=Mycena pura TaxID=153505 RepID=A0AAD6UV77_9AGAR|nr:hypothetical protein GGX14DRAFT_575711 [Mycena pura]